MSPVRPTVPALALNWYNARLGGTARNDLAAYLPQSLSKDPYQRP